MKTIKKTIKTFLLGSVMFLNAFTSNAQWSVTGNSIAAGANPVPFLGPTTDYPFLVKQFGTEKIQLRPGGSVTIGNPYAYFNGPSNSSFGTNNILIGKENYANGDNNYFIGKEVKSDLTISNSVGIGNFLTMNNGGFVLANGVSSTSKFASIGSNTLAVGFNSTIPTFFVGASSGAGTTGNVGIATTNPSYKLDVNGGIRGTNVIAGSPPFSTSDQLRVWGTTRLDGNTSITGTATISSTTTVSGTLNAIDGKFSNTVAVGTTCVASGYKLSVKGKIICEELKVKLEGGNCWADYVFNEDYKLMTIEDLENYIQQKHHLPNIPSAEQVKEEGIDVSEMQVKQMEKIEELTLYLIQMKKENDLLFARLKTLEEQLNK